MSSTEDEQLADFKEWWSRNGKPLVTGGHLPIGQAALGAKA